MHRIKLYTVILLLSLPFCSLGQRLNIIGDTILVSADNFPKLRFESSFFKRRNTSCDEKNYLIPANDNEITIRPGTSQPVSPCMLYVDEADEDGKLIRSHQFILIYVNSPISIDELLHDYSSDDKLQERIAYLAEAKRNAKNKPRAAIEQPYTEPAAPAPAPVQHEAAPLHITSKSPDVLDVDGIVITRAEFEQKVNKRIDAFSNDLGVLVQKKDHNLNGVIKVAMEIFNNDDSVWVEVTDNRTNMKKPHKHIRHYLKDVSQLNYDDVLFKNGERRFVGGITKQSDNTYAGTMVCVQDFSALRDGRIVSRSKTEKSYTIKLIIWDDVVDGKQTKKWAVFLGNISVVETKK